MKPRHTLLALAVLIAGCATSGGPLPTERDGTDLLVEVRNDHWLPMRVWALWDDNTRIYLGQVYPEGHYLYRIPSSTLEFRGDCRLLAEAMGNADEVTTDPIDWTAHRVRWHLEKQLLSSRPHVF